MKLSTKTRYGVRAVFDIAYHGGGKPTQARDIANRQDVPLRYLEQLFQELRRAKLVEGKRGPNGGYWLARRPEAITIGDVVRAMQGPIELLMDDSSQESEGGTTKVSVSAIVWKELAQKISACFDDVTMADLCARAEKLGIRRGDPVPAESDAGRIMYFI